MNTYRTTLAAGHILEDCYRLRYRIYVEEMQRKQRYADHRRRVVVDPFDQDGVVIACYESGGESLVGTIRLNRATSPNPLMAEYLALYGIPSSSDLARVSITTRLMVSRGHRTLSAVTSLVSAVYSLCLENGVTEDYMDCNPPLPQLAMQFGYRSHKKNVHHPEYGEVEVMKLAVEDIEHLERISSPFAAIAKSMHHLS